MTKPTTDKTTFFLAAVVFFCGGEGEGGARLIKRHTTSMQNMTEKNYFFMYQHFEKYKWSLREGRREEGGERRRGWKKVC